MRHTQLSLNKRGRRIVNEFRSKGSHMAREFNRVHILAALDSKVPERQIMQARTKVKARICGLWSQPRVRPVCC